MDSYRDIINIAEQISGEKDEFKLKAEKFVGLREQSVLLINYLRCAMFPNIFSNTDRTEGCLKDTCIINLQNAFDLLKQILSRNTDRSRAESLAVQFLKEMPDIKAFLLTDAEAAYKGDPAAQSIEEVMLTYPGFDAVSIFRLAHALYLMQVPIIPRMMTEYAHQKTGIDIHPGASVGRYFFIDHGTGVVIGETAVIGEGVKIYQGVTLGAKSFATNEDGTLVKGIKRHPDIGNNVIIYAGATILGGTTKIGDGCTIGSNVWITHSVEAGQTVIYNAVEK